MDNILWMIIWMFRVDYVPILWIMLNCSHTRTVYYLIVIPLLDILLRYFVFGTNPLSFVFLCRPQPFATTLCLNYCSVPAHKNTEVKEKYLQTAF